MIVFIDTEVDPQTKKVADYGAVREDGAVLHSHSKADFDAFVSKCDTICGHNIINHDLKYTALRGNPYQSNGTPRGLRVRSKWPRMEAVLPKLHESN